VLGPLSEAVSLCPAALDAGWLGLAADEAGALPELAPGAEPGVEAAGLDAGPSELVPEGMAVLGVLAEAGADPCELVVGPGSGHDVWYEPLAWNQGRDVLSELPPGPPGVDAELVVSGPHSQKLEVESVWVGWLWVRP